MNMNKILIVIFLLSSFLFPLSSFSQAAPEFLVTWKASSYAPSDYLGRILPSRGAPVEVNFELVDKNKIADLSKNEIRWYLDNKLQKTGKGIKKFNFAVANFADQTHQIRMTVIKYKTLGDLEKSITIPIVSPQVVIDAPYANNRIRSGLNSFRALPYFFNIADLSQLIVEWSANGQKTSGAVANPEILDLNITGGKRSAEINLSVNAKNRANKIEQANESIKLVIGN